MIESIVLLTPACQQQMLADVLRRHNPELTILPAETLAEIEAIEHKVLAHARLVAFTTDVIVPAVVLHALGYGAYNFHPGPPTYPGWLPACFALYDASPTFGATAHRMIEQVDAGAIVGVEWFDVAPGTNLWSLEAAALSHLAHLFWELAAALATQCLPLADLPVCWAGRKSSRRLYESACDIPIDISAEELTRRVRAFSGVHDGPTITLHGYQFRIMAQGAAAPG